MDGIIFLIVLIPIVFFFLLIAILSKSNLNQEALKSLKNQLGKLEDQLSALEKNIKELKVGSQVSQPITGDTSKQQEEAEEKKTWRPIRTFVPAGKEEFVPPKQPAATSEDAIKKEPVPAPVMEEEITTTKTDWEKFIGENLANKIGIAVLVLGISFFVKFAIDKNWINEGGRVITGLISGGILIGLAHYIRNSYRSFSSVLVGGGLTVFYFTIAFAFHQYHLISQQAAFIIMVVITAFAVILSIFYNRIELAILATIGGFITPFLLTTGQNNYVALFTYLGILNSGLLVLSWFKRWKAINIIALLFTVVIYGSWLFRQLYLLPEPFPSRPALFFATLFYLLSMAINIVNNLKLKTKFGAFDFILLLTINFLYYVAGIVILDYWDSTDYKGLFTVALGIFNLLLTLIFLKQKQVDRNIVLLLTGLTILFISLAGPVQLKGNHITLFWAAEAVVLFWLYQRSRMVLLKTASLLLLLPLIVSLLMDWSQIYGTNTRVIPLLINKGFVTTIVTTIAFFLYYKLVKKETDEDDPAPALSNRSIRNILLVGGIWLAYASGAWEVYYQFLTRLPDTLVYAVYLQLYSFTFIIIVLYLFRNSSYFTILKFTITVTGFIFYCYNLRTNAAISEDMLTTGDYSGHFIAHWISAALLIWLFYDLVIYFRKQQNMAKDYGVSFTWIASSCLVFILSIEMHHAMMWATYRDAGDWLYWENLYYKAGLSILWGLCSFAMMWLGMKHSFRTLRIISLTLFTITLVKLFLYDIQNIPPGGKIAAFILLGILLLIISFMYQRLKKIIIGGQQQNN